MYWITVDLTYQALMLNKEKDVGLKIYSTTNENRIKGIYVISCAISEKALLDIGHRVAFWPKQL